MTPEGGSVTFSALGTTAVVLVTEPGALTRAVDAVEREVAAIDAACSRFREDSELSRLNGASGKPVIVSPLFLEAVDVALRAAHRTGGVVDPTVGTAMRLIGYDRTFSELDPDGPPLRVNFSATPGWRCVHVDRERSSVTLARGVLLDLGATAKAWCADRAASAAASLTGSGVLVGLGGDLAMSGKAPLAGWSVLVADDHAAPLDGCGTRVAIHAGGLATSGTSVRRWRRGEEPLHHVVDPSSGRPARSCWRTVSVAAASCVDANTASTAAVILAEKGPEWLAERGLPARLVRVDGHVTAVAGWPADEPAARPDAADDLGADQCSR